MSSTRQHFSSIRQHSRKPSRLANISCRFDNFSFFPKRKQNVVDSTTFLVDSTTFPEFSSTRQHFSQIRQHFRKCCRIDNISRRFDNISGKVRRLVFFSKKNCENTYGLGKNDKKNTYFYAPNSVKTLIEKCCAKMLSTRQHISSNRQHFQKCCRVDEICCRVDEISGNVVESTRNVVESTTFSIFTPKRKSCRVEQISRNVVDSTFLSSRRHFQFYGKKEQVAESTRNVVEPKKFQEMLSNRREMLSSRRNLRECCRVFAAAFVRQ